MIKKLLLLLIGLSCFNNLFSQNIKYLIELADKKNNRYSVQHPEEFLSQKSIDRRLKQNIAIKENDLPISDFYIQEITKAGVTVLNKSKWLNSIVISTKDSLSIKKIRTFSFVKKITKLSDEVNNRVASKFDSEQNEIARHSGFEFNYGPSYNQSNMIGIDCMHKMGYTGKGLLIALLDAGYYKVDSLPAFKRIRDNGQILGTRDIVAGNNSVYEDHNHGTVVLSTISGYMDGNIIGTAPDAHFWLIRTEDTGAEYLQEEVFWTIGAELADSIGADIINSSLGYSVFDDSTTNHTYADLDGNTTIITKAADLAASKGIFVCASAGNSGGAPWFKITAPSDADSVLTIGAVDSVEKITNFSGRGPSFDGRVKPDICTKGSKVTYASPWGGIGFGGGTSFSSPIAAGAVACLWQANPSVSSFQLMDVVKKSADRYSAPDSVYGYGIPNFCLAHSFLNQSVSIDELEQMMVYPNPFHNYLQISFYVLKDDDVVIELYDVTGKIIRSQKNEALANYPNVFIVDESTNLSSGIYFIRVKTSEKTIVKKIIRN